MRRAIERAVTAGSRVSRARAGLESQLGRGRSQRTVVQPRPILLEVGLPALLMGFSFPLAQRDHSARGAVGRPPRGRSLSLQYLRRRLRQPRRRVSAAAGARDSGQRDGLDASAPRWRSCRCISRRGAIRAIDGTGRTRRPTAAAPTRCWSAALQWRCGCCCLRTTSSPARRLALENERLLHASEGLTEVVAVTETCRRRDGRSSRTATRCRRRRGSRSATCARWRTCRCSSIDRPETVLVIGFGVGNTTHAATLHPSIRRVEVADLSRGILDARRLLQRRQSATC